MKHGIWWGLLALGLVGCDGKQLESTLNELYGTPGIAGPPTRYALGYARRVDPADSADQGRISRFVGRAVLAGSAQGPLTPEALQELIANATAVGEAAYAHPVRTLVITYPDSVVRVLPPWELHPREQRAYDSLLRTQPPRRP
jgi:hypothetical protein